MSPTLDSLPSELLLHLADIQEAQDVVQLAACSKLLRTILTSDDVWKPRCVSLWAQHSDQPFSVVEGECESVQDGYYRIWSYLLGQYEKYLGFWASQLPFTGRLIRVSIQTDDQDYFDWLDRFCIRACQITATNVVTAEDIAVDRPAGAWFDADETSYILPLHHPSPYRGLSVDIFKPRFTYSPLFEIRASTGPRLLSDGPNTRSSATLFLNLKYNRDHTTPVNAYRALAGNNLTDLVSGGNSLPTFPTFAAANNGVLRSPVYYNDNKTWMSTPSMTWAPRYVESPFEGTVPDFPLPPRQGPSFIYQDPPRVQPRRPVATTIRVMRDIANALPMVFHLGPEEFREGGDRQRHSNGEQFIPINGASSGPLCERGRDIPPESLQGLWAGGFGPHGVELGYVNIRTVATSSRNGSVNMDDVCEVTEGADHHSLQKIIEYVKVTGDTNVPSGAVSWTAFLPNQRSGKVAETLPTVDATDLRRWMQFPSRTGRTGEAGWDAGTVEARGQIAFTNFIEPRFIKAHTTFVRSPHPLNAAFDSVDEIRLRWRDLHKVSVFRRLPCSL